MSLVKSKAIQLGFDATPTNNFLIYQPLTPDGTFRIANGNQGATTDIMTVTSGGSVTFAGTTNFSSLNFGAGSSGAPSLFPTGDSDTGIFFPAANTVGITTGSTERFRISSTGVITIGSTSGSRVQLTPDDAGLELWENNYYIGGYYMDNNSIVLESAFAGNLIFKTDSDGTSSGKGTGIERMRIDNTGNVYIGASTGNIASYGKNLVIAATAAAYGGLELSGTTGGAIDFQTGQTTRQVQLVGNANGLFFNTNNSGTLGQRMHLDSAGRLALGASTVSDRMIYVTATAPTSGVNQFGLVFNPTYPNTVSSALYGGYFSNNLASGATLTNAYTMYLETGNYTGSTVTNKWGLYQAGANDKNYFAGNLSIGTTLSPSKLTVAGEMVRTADGGVDGNFLTVMKYGTAVDLTSGNNTANRWNGIDSTITAGGASSNIMRIRLYRGSSAQDVAPATVADFRGDLASIFYGNVGVGTSSPAFGLDVNGTSRFVSTGQTYTMPFLIKNNGQPSNNRNCVFLDAASTGSLSSTINFGTSAGGTSPYYWVSNWNILTDIGANGGKDFCIVSNNNTGVTLANASSTSWSSYSDPRLKNITGTYDQPLVDIQKIKPIKFTWKNDDDNKPCVGVDASTVVDVVPEAVDEMILANDPEKIKYLTVRYTELIPLMIASIQELTAQNKELQARLDAAGL